MKIIPGDIDNSIINKRNDILGHLEKVLSGGKTLKNKNLEKYFKALGGKYVRNEMCGSGEKSACKGGKNAAVGGVHNLLKLASKKDFPMEQVLNTFKGSAPILYQKLESKISAANNNASNSENTRFSESSGGNNEPYKEWEPVNRERFTRSASPASPVSPSRSRSQSPGGSRGGFRDNFRSRFTRSSSPGPRAEISRNFRENLRDRFTRSSSIRSRGGYSSMNDLESEGGYYDSYARRGGNHHEEEMYGGMNKNALYKLRSELGRNNLENNLEDNFDTSLTILRQELDQIRFN